MADREKIFTFVANDPEGLPSNRKQTRRACEHCRKRKRRCAHGPRLAPRLPGIQSPRNSTINDTCSQAVGQESLLTTGDVYITGTARDTHPISQPHGQGARNDGESWFVGNMDPEGAFLIAASPDSNPGAIRRHDLGVWLPARNAYSHLAVKKPRSSLISCPDPLVSSVFLPYLEDQCLSVLPAPGDMEELLRIHMENIHPIFPVIDLDSYQAMPRKSPEKILLSQSICIATSIDRNAKQYLNMPTVTTSHADFSRSLLEAVNTSIALGLVRDKLVLIQTLSLTSLFMQFSGDRQESAELLSRAICHAHTIGLHHRCHSSMSTQKEKTSTRLFCCVYALDVLNSACLGRPVQFHRQDFGRDLLSSIAAQEGCFQLFLRTILLMERVIEIYRPAENGVWKGSFPSFEDLLQEVGTSTAIPMHLTATIEVLYHAAAILSCHSTNLYGVSRPSSETNVRQSLSASRVTYIVGDEFHNQLSLFPIIPYAVALSLRVSWHSFQQSKAAIFQARARKQVVANCAILRELGEAFYCASLMADLGERLIKDLDRKQEGEERETQDQVSLQINKSTNKSADLVSPVEPSLHNTEGSESVESTYQSYDPSFFDPMSFLGIFDNFDLEIGATGELTHGSP